MRIPRLSRSRSTLWYNTKQYGDGSCRLYVSSDIYPELLTSAFPDIEKSPETWKTTDKGNQKYIWLSASHISISVIQEIMDWCERFQDHVLIGLNQNMSIYFSNELDFCLALAFNRIDPKSDRTLIGEAEYLLKYKLDYILKERAFEYLTLLRHSVGQAYADLPFLNGNELVTSIPVTEKGKKKLAWFLTKALSKDKDLELLTADLCCSRPSMKNLPVSDKVNTWKTIYSEPDNIELSTEIRGRSVIIVDDLYQSGASIWSYSKFLKQNGAGLVIGIVCVKSLRDSDNQ